MTVATQMQASHVPQLRFNKYATSMLGHCWPMTPIHHQPTL